MHVKKNPLAQRLTNKKGHKHSQTAQSFTTPTHIYTHHSAALNHLEQEDSTEKALLYQHRFISPSFLHSRTESDHRWKRGREENTEPTSKTGCYQCLWLNSFPFTSDQPAAEPQTLQKAKQGKHCELLLHPMHSLFWYKLLFSYPLEKFMFQLQIHAS